MGLGNLGLILLHGYFLGSLCDPISKPYKQSDFLGSVAQNLNPRDFVRDDWQNFDVLPFKTNATYHEHEGLKTHEVPFVRAIDKVHAQDVGMGNQMCPLDIQVLWVQELGSSMYSAPLIHPLHSEDMNEKQIIASTFLSEKLDHSIIQNIGIENMKKIWPDLMFGVESYDFWEHEWDKHGTCTGIPQGKYFSEAISLYEKIGTPELISKNINKVLAREDVLQSFGGELPQAILLCDDENRRNLSQVYICFGVEDPAFSADSGDLNLKRIPCPDSVASENTCGDDIVVPSYHVFSSSSSVSTV